MPAPPDEVTAAEFRAAVEQAVEELPPTLRAVVRGRLVEARDSRDLALELGLTPGALRVRWHRGLRRLRQVLPAGLASLVAGGSVRGLGLGAARERVVREAARRVAQAGSLPAATAVTSAGLLTVPNVLVAGGLAAVAVVVGLRFLGNEGEDVDPITGASCSAGQRSRAPRKRLRPARSTDAVWPTRRRRRRAAPARWW